LEPRQTRVVAVHGQQRPVCYDEHLVDFSAEISQRLQWGAGLIMISRAAFPTDLAK